MKKDSSKLSTNQDSQSASCPRLWTEWDLADNLREWMKEVEAANDAEPEEADEEEGEDNE